MISEVPQGAAGSNGFWCFNCIISKIITSSKNEKMSKRSAKNGETTLMDALLCCSIKVAFYLFLPYFKDEIILYIFEKISLL